MTDYDIHPLNAIFGMPIKLANSVQIPAGLLIEFFGPRKEVYLLFMAVHLCLLRWRRFRFQFAPGIQHPAHHG